MADKQLMLEQTKQILKSVVGTFLCSDFHEGYS